MRHARTYCGVAAGTLFLGAMLIFAPVASGAALFTFVPSYASYGGLSYVGTHVRHATGTGVNYIYVTPSFSVSTGNASESTDSYCCNVTGGTYSIAAWTGVQSVAFTCSGTCGTALTNSLLANWSISYSTSVTTSCAAGIIIWASVSIVVTTILTDLTTVSTVKTVDSQVYSHHLTAPGTFAKSGVGTIKAISVKLVSGDKYEIKTFVTASVMAHSSAGAVGNFCSSGAYEAVKKGTALISIVIT
jgi:hypothetical protein